MGEAKVNDLITVQDLVDGRLDVKGIASFYNGAAGVKVPRRLAGDIETLEFYLEYFRGLQAVYEQESGLVDVNGVKVKPVKQALTDALDAAVVGGGGLADTAVAATAKHTGSVARTLAAKLAESISFEDFGADPSGNTDSTLAFRKTIAVAVLLKKQIIQNGGSFLVNNFDLSITGGFKAAIKITGSLKIAGKFVIKATSATVTDTIFACDDSAQNIDVDISGIYFDTVARNRAFYATTDAVLNTLKLRIATKYSSLVSQCTVKSLIDISKNQIGQGITATTPITPMFVVSIPEASTHTPVFNVSNNWVIGGTEVAAGLFAIHRIPNGGICEKNVVVDLGRSGTEGYDIDGLGAFAHFVKNVAIYCGFEYKTSAGSGIDSSRDAFFHDNYSYEGFSPFSIRSSCNSRGNVAYNPTGWGLYMGNDAGSDPRIANSALCDINGFTVVWAGAEMNGAARIAGTFKKLSLRNFRVVIDPVYAANHPDAKIPASFGAILHIKGDGIKDIDIDDLYVEKSTVPQILIRSDTSGARSSGIRITNPTFGDCDAACIDAIDSDYLTIVEPKFPANIGDRAVRALGCKGLSLTSRDATKTDNILTAPTNVGATINGYGISFNTEAGKPLNQEYYRVGNIVKNNFDATYYLKISTGLTTGWVKLATAI